MAADALPLLKDCGHRCVVVAFSGGPDSMALLHLLTQCADRLRQSHSMTVDIIAAHCNFHLRGEESMRDESFCRDVCARMQVRLLTIDFDTLKYCEEQKLSIETGARRLRHEWFAQICRSHDALLATGHNADDNAETLLLNLMRGAGCRGLKAMSSRDRNILRPLIHFSRKEILQYLDLNGLEYVTDSTNLSTDYRRNFLRHEVLPLLRSRWAGADKAISRTLRCLADDNAIIEQAIADALGDDHMSLPIENILRFASPTLLILRFTEPYGGTPEIAAEIAASICTKKRNIGASWLLPRPSASGSIYRIKAENKVLRIFPAISSTFVGH